MLSKLNKLDIALLGFILALIIASSGVVYAYASDKAAFNATQSQLEADSKLRHQEVMSAVNSVYEAVESNRELNDLRSQYIVNDIEDIRRKITEHHPSI